MAAVSRDDTIIDKLRGSKVRIDNRKAVSTHVTMVHLTLELAKCTNLKRKYPEL